MRIIHICLASYYVDGYSYQENIFPRINHEQGHDVLIIASTETFLDNKTLGYVSPSEYTTEYGVRIIRLPYRKIFNLKISSKLRYYKGLYKNIQSFNPNIIYLHDASFGSINEICVYAKKNREVKVYIDTHTAIYNSGTTWVSMTFLHKFYYKRMIQKILPYTEKYFYIGLSERDFNKDVYRVPESLMEFLPLGGLIPNDKEYCEVRMQIRNEYGIADDELIMVHSGKLTPAKKTLQILEALRQVPELSGRLIIVGSIREDCREEIENGIDKDDRVEFIGWKDAESVRDLLCAADIYLHPGGLSVTVQDATCCFCPVMVYPYETYTKLDCGNFIFVNNVEEMSNFFKTVHSGKIDLNAMTRSARHCAYKYMDYRKLANRYITGNEK